MKSFKQLREELGMGGLLELPQRYGYVSLGVDDMGNTHFHHQGMGHKLLLKADGEWNHHLFGAQLPIVGNNPTTLGRTLRKIHGVK